MIERLLRGDRFSANVSKRRATSSEGGVALAWVMPVAAQFARFVAYSWRSASSIPRSLENALN